MKKSLFILMLLPALAFSQSEKFTVIGPTFSGVSRDYIDTVYLSGTNLTFVKVGLAFGGVIDLSGLNTDSQTLSISGDTIFISGGNFIVIPGGFTNIYLESDTFVSNRTAWIKQDSTFEILGNLGAAGNRSRFFMGNVSALLNAQNSGNTAQVAVSTTVAAMEYNNGTNIASFQALADRTVMTTDSDGSYVESTPGRAGIWSNEPATSPGTNEAAVFVGNSLTDPHVYIQTDGVGDGSVSNGWVLTLTDAATGRVEFTEAAADTNGMFSAANQNGTWAVTIADLGGNTGLFGQSESFGITNTVGGGVLHSLSVGVGNTANQLRSQNGSGDNALVTTQNVQAHISANNGVTTNSRMLVGLGTATIVSGSGSAQEVGMDFDGVNGFVELLGLVQVTGATPADADANAASASVPANHLYEWDDGDAIFIMKKQ